MFGRGFGAAICLAPGRSKLALFGFVVAIVVVAVVIVVVVVVVVVIVDHRTSGVCGRS